MHRHAADEDILIVSATETILILAADEHIASIAAIENVVPVAANEHIVAVATKDIVVAIAAQEDIVASRTISRRLIVPASSGAAVGRRLATSDTESLLVYRLNVVARCIPNPGGVIEAGCDDPGVPAGRPRDGPARSA